MRDVRRGEPIIRGIELCPGVFHRGQGTSERILDCRLDSLTCRDVTFRQSIL